MPKKIFTQEEKEQIIKRYEFGEGSSSIGADYGCSGTTLLKNLKLWGIQPNSKKLDLTGQVFGRLTVLEPGPKQGKENTWICECSCSAKTHVTVKISNLRNGHTKSCGCLKREPSKKFIDLTGQIFNEWTVISKAEKESYWHCRCSCGVERDVYAPSLKKQLSKSCGHLKAGLVKKPIINQRFGMLVVKEQLPYSICKCACDCGTIIYVKRSNLISGNTKSCGCNQYKAISKNMNNMMFGFLQPLCSTDKRKHGSIVWRCLCHNCNQECEVTQHALADGRTESCGCVRSIGELKIQQILQKCNIAFEKEKTFEDLINPNTGFKLRYDFYLPASNCLIEFDGIQHYQSIDFFDEHNDFEDRQYKDCLKNEYALANGIRLIRIPYWEKNNITLDLLLSDQYLVSQSDIEEAEEVMVEVE